MKSANVGKFAEWKASLLEVEECPYVGPRPQSPRRDGPDVLIGREPDLERINGAVLKRPLVILDGPSGVGKSSLLMNGLLSRLEESGFEVCAIRRWAGTGAQEDDFDLEHYLRACLVQTFAEEDLGSQRVQELIEKDREAGLTPILDALEAQAGGAVLILDQFEELLRQRGEVARSVCEWIRKRSYTHETRTILSLRSEYVYLLESLTEGFRPFSIDKIRLEELSDQSAIEQVILRSRSGGRGAGEKPIAPRAAERLLNAWIDQRPHPRLLDLQAVLYSAHFRAKARQAADGGAVAITLDDIEALFSTGDEASQADVFARGLEEALKLKLDHARNAALRTGLDEYLVVGTEEMVRRIAPFLSSGDFKVPIDQRELVGRVLAKELQVLYNAMARESESSSVEPLSPAATMEEPLSTLFRAPDLLARRPREPSSGKRGSDSLGTLVAPCRQTEVTAGPMMFASAKDALFEELRRAVFALEWLECLEIARRDPTGAVLLVHDRAGRALNRWVADTPQTPDVALRRITAAHGERYRWTDGEIGGDEHRVFANLNWRECRITANFRNVIFLNCDFTASRFDGCSFHGVTFLNCLLDDANFEACSIQGDGAPARLARNVAEMDADANLEKVRLAPSFYVDAPREEISAFEFYGASRTGELQALFSDTSNLPALPIAAPRGFAGDLLAHFVVGGDEEPQDPALVPASPARVAPSRGGVAIIGGRLCFLTVYGCRVKGDAVLAFHHVAGEGLYLVDHAGGRIDIHDSAIRGVSVSTDSDQRADTAKAAAPLDIVVNDSIVANVYLSGGLRGNLLLEYSFVVGLVNAGENSEEGLRANLRDCRYQFVANATCDGGIEDSDMNQELRYFEAVGKTQSRFSLCNRVRLARELESMDYRYRPEVWEARQRARRRRHSE